VSFSEDVREELAALPLPPSAHCRHALLAGLVRTAGTFHLHGRGDVHVEVSLQSGRPARHAIELLRSLGVTCEIRTHRDRRFGGASRVDIVCAGDSHSHRVLHAAGVLTASLAPMGSPPPAITARACCRAAYLRGAFLAAGSVSAPRRAVHLEIRTHDVDAAGDIAALAGRDGLTLAVRDRSAYGVAYAKRLETVEDLLALIGASGAALRLAEGEVVSQAREGANRKANAETGNLRRQVLAARRQLAAIDALDRGALSPALAGAAALRKAHPSLPLAELAALGDLPKATLAARLRRLVDLAELA
jgi:cell division protein WhiA